MESNYEAPKSCELKEYVIAISEPKLDHTYYNHPINKKLSTIKEYDENEYEIIYASPRR